MYIVHCVFCKHGPNDIPYKASLPLGHRLVETLDAFLECFSFEHHIEHGSLPSFFLLFSRSPYSDAHGDAEPSRKGLDGVRPSRRTSPGGREPTGLGEAAAPEGGPERRGRQRQARWGTSGRRRRPCVRLEFIPARWKSDDKSSRSRLA